MKKITRMTIFGAALLALSACNKEEVSAPKTLKLNLNITNSLDTKAVKTGWEDGDKVYVFFGKPEDHPTPAYLTLTYNGGMWSEAWTEGLEAEIAATTTGTLTAAYSPGDIGPITYGSYQKEYRFNQHKAGYYLRCNNVSYTVSAGVLSATLEMKSPTKDFVHFYLAEEAANAENLKFSGDKILKVRLAGISSDGSTSQGNSGYGDNIDAVVYKGGLSFSGLIKDDARGVARSHTLTITDTKGTADTSDDVVYTTSATKTINIGDAFKLPALDNAAWTVSTP